MYRRHKTIISDTIKDLRRKRGYTQKQVADLLGVDRSTYCYYELGKIKPDINTVMKLSNIFGVHYSDILEIEYNSEKFKDSEISFVDAYPDVNGFGCLNNEEKCLLLAFRVVSDASRKEIIEFALRKVKDNQKKNI